MKKIYTLLAGLLIVTIVVIGLKFSGGGGNASATQRICDTNSIINCGALTADELKSKYAANATGDLKDIYAYYGVNADMMSNASTAKIGQVSKNGKVTMDGKVIAIDAQSIGREYVDGSTAVNINGKTVYQRSTQSVFGGFESLDAFIFQRSDGSLSGIILLACGNPVAATSIIVTPAYTCDTLSSTKISQTTNRFNIAYTVKNATFKSVTYVIKDASGKVIDTKTSTDKTLDYEQSTAGKYTVQATVTVVANDKNATATSEGCKAVFEIAETPVTPPTPPTTPPTTPELPKTGISGILASIVGLGTLVTGTGYYIKSRRI